MSNIECLNEYVSTGNLPQQDAFIKKSIVLVQVRKFQTRAYNGIAYFRSSNRSKIRFNLKLSMKKFVFFVLGSLTMLGLQAQGNEPYEFKEYKRYAATPIKSQDQTAGLSAPLLFWKVRPCAWEKEKLTSRKCLLSGISTA